MWCRQYWEIGEVEFEISESIFAVVVPFNLFICLSAQKNSSYFFAVLDRKRLKAAKLLVNLWTSLIVLGDLISMMVWTFSGFAPSPCCDTRYPKNFLLFTLKLHLSGFNFNPKY